MWMGMVGIVIVDGHVVDGHVVVDGYGGSSNGTCSSRWIWWE